MRSIRETLKSLGIEVESRYFIYTTKDKMVLVPYNHIRSMELKDNKVIVSTGGMERLVIETPSEVIAKQLFDELILQLEKTYL